MLCGERTESVAGRVGSVFSHQHNVRSSVICIYIDCIYKLINLCSDLTNKVTHE